MLTVGQLSTYQPKHDLHVQKQKNQHSLLEHKCQPEIATYDNVSSKSLRGLGATEVAHPEGEEEKIG